MHVFMFIKNLIGNTDFPVHLYDKISKGNQEFSLLALK